MVQEVKPQFLFLLEIKATSEKVNNLKFRLGYQNSFVVSCRGRSGGIALFWHEEVNFNLISFSQNHIDGLVTYERKQWRLSGFYGHLEEENRGLAWDLLRWLRGSNTTPWLIGGISMVF